jgi:Fis family transcriptional regulator
LQALGDALKVYFDAHVDGNIPTGLYNRVIQEVEGHLLRQTMEFTENNQIRAARILGISRNTLRKKLAELGGERREFLS